LHQDGIWSDRSASLELVARRGNQAPGTPDGVKFDVIRAGVRLNDAGQIAFYAVLIGTGVDSTNDRGIWLEDSGNMTLVARAGNQAPGTPGGVSYSNFSPFEVGTLTLNATGQVAFGAVLTGNGVDFTNDRGIFVTDVTGATQLLVRTGEQLQVADGDVRTVSDLKFVGGTNNSNGLPSGFNNHGQLAFWARFTDGSQGVFVSDAVAHVPGDFNNDGTVDAADYVAWRKGLGTIYDQNDYEVWRAHFGSSLGVGSGSVDPRSLWSASADPLSAAIPEPAGATLLSSWAAVVVITRRRVASRVPLTC
jgi:hypothetical protein